jgi:hypothetical protein
LLLWLKTGRLLKELAILLGNLSKGLIIFIAKKARTEGKPKAIQLARWSKQKTIILITKTNEVGTPKTIEAGQLLESIHYICWQRY